LLLKIQKVIREYYLDESVENAFDLKKLSQFMESLDANHTKYHKVKEYADLMAISPRKLNDIIKLNFGSTAKELISTKLFMEVVSKLQFTHDSIKEIAYQFGFSSPYHLSHFFTSMIPTGIPRFCSHIAFLHISVFFLHNLTFPS